MSKERAIDKSTICECYQLLRNVLLDAFNVSVGYFTPPYRDITKIDQGIRAAVWTDYEDSDAKVDFGDTSQKYRILVIKSNLGFYNVLVTLGAEAKPDFLAIGPFRNEELSPAFYAGILKEAHVSTGDIQGIKGIYERMPFVHVDVVINITKHILESFIPGMREVTPQLLEYSEQKRTIKVNTALLAENSTESSIQYKRLLFAFLEPLKLGDYTGAKKALHAFLREMNLTVNKNMRDMKIVLQLLNDYCHMALLQTSIHPFYIMRQAISFNTQIANTTSLARLEQMPGDICHKYCLLVKNYANPEYSRLTKDVIAYIQLHLEEELSLNCLAIHFNKNASVLSNAFSKDTGQTLTQFIHQTRIQEAILLFNTTNMSVSEVAMAVGYQDFSYFSKVFSKNVGCSPREYLQHKA